MSDLPAATNAKGLPPAVTTPARRLLDDWLLGAMSERLVGKGHRELRDRFEADVIAMADDLAGPSPTPVEATLAMTAAVCWAELRYLQGCEHQPSPSRTIAQADLALRRIDRAHRRYLATIRALATVRRLAAPTLQVNIAREQVVRNEAAP